MSYNGDKGWTRREKVSVALMILGFANFILMGWLSAKWERTTTHTTESECHCLGCGS